MGGSWGRESGEKVWRVKGTTWFRSRWVPGRFRGLLPVPARAAWALALSFLARRVLQTQIPEKDRRLGLGVRAATCGEGGGGGWQPRHLRLGPGRTRRPALETRASARSVGSPTLRAGSDLRNHLIAPPSFLRRWTAEHSGRGAGFLRARPPDSLNSLLTKDLPVL